MSKVFLISEVASNIVNGVLVAILLPKYGVVGAGMAFFGMYVWSAPILILVSFCETKFSWSSVNRRLIVLMGSLVIIVFIFRSWFSGFLLDLLGAALVLIVGVACLFGILRRIPEGQFRFLAKLRPHR
jgi:PST family polysaccharide transporter